MVHLGVVPPMLARIVSAVDQVWLDACTGCRELRALLQGSHGSVSMVICSHLVPMHENGLASVLPLSNWHPNRRTGRTGRAGAGCRSPPPVPGQTEPSPHYYTFLPQTLQDEQEGRGLLIPLLRSLGNVAAGGGAAAVEQLLSPDAAPALQALVTCAQVRGAAAPACWGHTLSTCCLGS